MAWWREALFGMFINWGLYSVPAGNYQDKPASAEWIMLRSEMYAGLEGTVTYGAGLCHYLLDNGIDVDVDVYEVNRPNRAKSKLVGKSAPTDAENAARSVFANESKAIPKNS